MQPLYFFIAALKRAYIQPEGLNLLCNSIWLWQNSKRQQKPCLSSLSCPIKQQASYLWDSLTTTARDKPMPLCPAARQGEVPSHTHTHTTLTHTKHKTHTSNPSAFSLCNSYRQNNTTAVPCAKHCFIMEMPAQNFIPCALQNHRA